MLLLPITGLIVGLLTLVELRWPARTEAAPRGLNLAIWAVRLALQLTVVPVVGLVIAEAGRRLGAPSLEIRRWPLVCSAAAFVLAMDLAEYLYHRAQHAVPWLWRRHALHHSDPCVSATTTERHWWGDLVLKAMLFGGPLAIVLQPGPRDYAVYSGLALWHYLVHANLKIDFGRFSWALNCPAYHRLHHASAAEHHGANYAALFPIFDVLAGSYRRPTAYLQTGLESEPTRVLEALAWPPAAAAPV
ncbi:MAG: sterol desaturase [Phenylobacterium sp.]|nr:sterol desaturase [Phenylobacterium sp.]